MGGKLLFDTEKLDSSSDEYVFKVTEYSYGDNRNNLTVGIANIEAKVPDIEYNKRKIIEAIKVFKAKGVNIVMVPEFCLTGYFWENEKECWAYMDQGVTDKHYDWIRDEIEPLLDDTLQFVILNNIRTGPSDSRLYYNSTFVINKKIDYTDPKWIYDKTFLPGIEKVYTVSGNTDSLVLDTKWGRFGFSSCYDFCFAQVYQEMSRVDNVDAVLQSASWRGPATRNYGGLGISTESYYQDLWNMLMPATAARNQIWVIACNAVGQHDISGAKFAGSSGVWAPSGVRLAQVGDQGDELLIVHNLNLKREVKEERDDFNYHDDFKLVYKEIQGKRAFTRV